MIEFRPATHPCPAMPESTRLHSSRPVFQVLFCVIQVDGELGVDPHKGCGAEGKPQHDRQLWRNRRSPVNDAVDGLYVDSQMIGQPLLGDSRRDSPGQGHLLSSRRPVATGDLS